MIDPRNPVQFSDRLIMQAAEASGLTRALRRAFRARTADEILLLVCNLVTSGGVHFMDPDDLEFKVSYDFEDEIAELREAEDRERIELFERIEADQQGREAFFGFLQEAAGAPAEDTVVMEVERRGLAFKLDKGEEDSSHSDLLFVSRVTGRIFGLSRLTPGESTPDCAVLAAAKTGAIAFLAEESHSGELFEVVSRSGSRVICHPLRGGPLQGAGLEAAAGRWPQETETFPDKPSVRGMTDVFVAEPVEGFPPVRVSVFEDEGSADYRRLFREKIDEICREVNKRHGMQHLDAVSRMLVDAYLLREKNPDGPGFRYLINERKVLLGEASEGFRWYLSNFHIDINEAWRLGWERRDSEEFLDAEFCSDDERGIDVDEHLERCSPEAIRGREFVKFCALVCASELERTFTAAKMRLRAISGKVGDKNHRNTVKAVRRALDNDFQVKLLRNCNSLSWDRKRAEAYEMLRRITGDC
ncbi:hypothetical protein [Sutterella sp.]|uniref:hypothetical protein n=1 Tax=Sutterella sp. TaxID=1981025 RepID=UPI0026DFBE4B|nr:hypothetical protein [Sutterella sp.]MDO5531598.1 hypothetical protein [Sutterella sp.]